MAAQQPQPPPPNPTEPTPPTNKNGDDDDDEFEFKEEEEKEEEEEEDNFPFQIPSSSSSSSDSDFYTESSDSESSESESEKRSPAEKRRRKRERRRQKREERRKRQEEVMQELSLLELGKESGELAQKTAERNIRDFENVLNSRRVKMLQEELDEEKDKLDQAHLFNFPYDPENWREEDLREFWADAPLEMTKPGWDPYWADDEDWDVVQKEIDAGRDPHIAPFYVPYRKPYPIIPDNNVDIATPMDVIEELDRIEEFLMWDSCIFPDGSTYEGTVWDDLAHGRGVYVAESGLVRYEGEWVRNDMEGHGVVELDIPEDEPIPGSKHEEEMRAQGKIIARDYMSPEDRKWLEKDIEDTLLVTDGIYETPWYENEDWIKYFGKKPEKGRYRYAGQWKHGRMHGCGQYEVNEETVYGRFYFGTLLEEPYGCEDEIAAMHAGIAEVAAAKARMFVNKPDGMVREMWGPFSDPQHPYFYEEEDTWMAPGFINQFYEVPDLWKTYVEDVDEERQMWLNSFYRSPLRLPMPAELEYWWENEEVTPEFLLLNMEPKPDPDDPSKETIEPIILHTPTGRFINYTMDDEYGIRLYWEPEDGVVDPDKVEYLPLGFDEFYGRDTTPKKENFFTRFLSTIGKKHEEFLEHIRKKAEEANEILDLRKQVFEKELELIDAEIALEEAIEDMEQIMKMKEKEVHKKTEMGEVEETGDASVTSSSSSSSSLAKQDKKAIVTEDDDVDEDEDGDDDEDDDDAPSSFGSANTDQNLNKSDQKGGKSGPSLFSATSLSFSTSSLASGIPSMLRQSFLMWKKSRTMAKPGPGLPSCPEHPTEVLPRLDSVTFPTLLGTGRKLIIKSHSLELQAKTHPKTRVHRLRSLASLKKPKDKRKPERVRNHGWWNGSRDSEIDAILSLHTPVDYFEHLEKTGIC